VYAETLPLSGYTIGNVTLAAMWTWDGTVTGGFGEFATLGQRDDATRGIHLVYVTNGSNTDLVAYTNGTAAVLLTSVNLLGGAVGPHSLAIAPVDAVDASGHKWRFSYDGSTVADKVMGTTYVAPSATDALGLGARPDGVLYLNGRAIELAVWGSLLSNANILALATLPATPTYELPESASTGAAAIRVQACRYDPIMSATTMPARGVGKAITIASGVTKVTL